jgi:hypothetical protein
MITFGDSSRPESVASGSQYQSAIASTRCSNLALRVASSPMRTGSVEQRLGVVYHADELRQHLVQITFRRQCRSCDGSSTPPDGDRTFPVTNYGQPLTAAGFGIRMSQWCGDAGLENASNLRLWL